MKNFKSLSKEPVFDVETKIKDKWAEMDILNLTIKNRDNSPSFVFYDGPAFANGFPGLHHMVSKNLKDTVCKYKVMQGYKVLRKVGWDTHGLPIENHVEKKLGISSKKEIEAMGVEKFNQECRNSVRENEAAFIDLTNKMGQFIDVKNPYLTFKNEYIETEWWILKKFYEENLFYEGKRVVPYCTHCGTGLATHEVAQNYQIDKAITAYVLFKKKNEDVYFIAWTTTPWTLVANIGLCVNPTCDYALVESNGSKFILAESLVVSILGEEAKIIETFKGSTLENMEYEQLIPSVNVEGKAFIVTCDDYVTTIDGTGIVHLAGAFGEDDARVCEKYGIEPVNPVGKDGCYNEGMWVGENVFNVNEDIIKYLKENGQLLKKQVIEHDYPHCWRCNNPLIYYSMPSYYIGVSQFKDKLVEANKSVNWYPAYVGEKRFANWLENAKDWNISRSRYWGSPIPFWKCDCGHTEMIGSIEELKEKAIENITDDFDLHKPYIDEIHLKCAKCGESMKRIPDVLDCWFDSGSMPFAQYHYPFENEKLFESQFPADFICEGIDQTRGWFYTLLVISTFVKGVSPYKNVLVNDLLLDSEGKKMSKSKGNIVEPFSTMKEYGADTVRFYLPYVSPVWTPLKFDMEGIKEVYSKFFNPLKNTYNFFSLYANTDKIDIDECNIPYEKREEIDKWLLSKYNNLVKTVIDNFEEYDLNKVVRNITSFVSEDLSNWYIRRNRNRFWTSTLDDSKKSVYLTTYEVLVSLSKLIAPIIPFLSEELYTNLTGEVSVHLCDYPRVNNEYINIKVEEKMDLVRELISIGRGVREENKIKVRQPLKEVLLSNKTKNIIGDLTHLIEEELNVKNVTFIKDIDNYMSFTIKPNYKTSGPVFGNNIKVFIDYLNQLDTESISKIYTEEEFNDEIMVNDNKIIINKDMLDIRFTNKEGFNSGMFGSNFVILNTEISDSLKNEGNAREFVSKIQNLRKTNNYEVSDRIIIKYNSKELDNILKEFKDYISNETLCEDFIFDDTIKNNLVINDINLGVEITKK